MADKRRASTKSKQATGTKAATKSSRGNTRRATASSASSTSGRSTGGKKTATSRQRKSPTASTQKKGASKKSSTKKSNTKKSDTKTALKAVLTRKKSTPKAEQNRPQGSPEGRRKREQAKRKQRFDSVMADFKERTNIESLEPLTRVPNTLIGSGWHTSKITSTLLLFLAIATLYFIFTEPRFFVYADDVTFQNLNYLYPEELYPELEVDGWSIFWVRPDQVRQAVIEHSYVANADVSVELPARIRIAVEEEEPAALWVTDAGRHWVLEDGTALPVRTTQSSDLVQILDGQQDAAMADAEESFLVNTSSLAADGSDSSSREPTVIGAENLAAPASSLTNIDKRILYSALQLSERYPGLNQITYNRGYGLNFTLPQRSEWIYWGDGNNFSQKLENMAAIHHAIAKNEASASIIDLRSPEKPYYR